MKKKWNLVSVLAVIAVITLSSCTAPTQTPVALPSVQPTATAWEEPTETPAATEAASEFSSVVEYNLGETKIVQKNFPEDSTFREMPLLLNGLEHNDPNSDSLPKGRLPALPWLRQPEQTIILMFSWPVWTEWWKG